MTGFPGQAHLLLLLGAGGMSAPESLAAARQAGDVSVIHVAAWGHALPGAVERDVTGHGGQATVVGGPADVPDAARKLHAARPLDGVITYSEFLLEPQARVAADLGLRGNSPESVAIAQSKARQRETLRAAGARTPRFRTVRDRADLPGAIEDIGYPAVLKPEHGAASMGVLPVTGPGDLLPAWDEAHRIPSPFLSGPGASWVLEQRLTGIPPAAGLADYVSVESLVADGRAHHFGVVDRLAQHHGFLEEGAVYPSACDPEITAALEAETERAIRACGLRWGAVHTELKLTPGGPTVIEVNARLGGPVGHMFRLASDTDLAAEAARVAVGLPARLRAQPVGAAVVRMVPVPGTSHRLVHAASPDRLRESHPGLRYVRYRAAPGDTLTTAQTHVVSFMVTASDREAALSAAAAVEDDMDLRLVPAAESSA